jgi:hypothetical protein
VGNRKALYSFRHRMKGLLEAAAVPSTIPEFPESFAAAM